jgi:glycosyltransferase involved in cell wall biosynthesis
MKICFVSYEIAPTTKGGAGALIANAIHLLLGEKNSNHEIILLLDIPVEEYVRFEWHDRLFFPNYQNIRSYRVDELCADAPIQRDSFASYYLWESYRFDYALRKLMPIESPDIIEFFDYTGIAYIPLTRRLLHQNPENTRLAIRFHMCLMPIHKILPVKLAVDILFCYGMESRALELAEKVLFPSEVVLDEMTSNYYKLSSNTEVCISPPPLRKLPSFEDKPLTKTSILFFGYLGYLKGADTFLSAALLFLSRNTTENAQFLFIGGDLHEAPGGFDSFTQYMRARIPAGYQHRFIFAGQIPHDHLSKLLPEVRFAVMPSYIESFGYAAHELYAVGIPIIIRNIPVFTQFFHHEENALVFDGTVEDLAEKMVQLWENERLAARITKPYAVLPQPLGNCYDTKAQPCDAPKQPPVQLRLKVLILTERLLHLTQFSFENCTIWQLLSQPDDENPPFPFLGRLWWVHDAAGLPVPVEEWSSDDAILVITEHDTIDERFLHEAVGVLSQESVIGFVACWREVDGKIRALPIDAASELLITDAAGGMANNENYFAPARILYRTPRDKHFFDLYDNRMGVFTEVGYLWRLEEEGGKGITIPEAWINSKGRFELVESPRLDSAEFNYLYMNSSTQKQARIGHFLIGGLPQQLELADQHLKDHHNQELSSLKLAELDLKLLLKKLSTPPLGWLFKSRKNFRKLKKRYLEG